MDVKVQGQTVLERFDVEKEAVSKPRPSGQAEPPKEPDLRPGAAAALVKEFKGVEVRNVLTVEFVASSAASGGTASPLLSFPLLSFVEAVREDAIPESEAASRSLSPERARELVGEARAALEASDFDRALALSHEVFGATGAAGSTDTDGRAAIRDARVEALRLMAEVADPRSLAHVKRCMDRIAFPILADYKPEDPAVVAGVIETSLAVAAGLPAEDRGAVGRILGRALGVLPRLPDAALRRRLARELGFILDWRILGPVPWAAGTGSTADAFAAARPVDPSGPVDVGGEPLEWREYASPGPELDFEKAVGAYDRVSAYAYAEVELDSPRELLVKVGSDDAFRLWFNGEDMGGFKGHRGWRADQDTVAVSGVEGANTLLLQVMDNRGGWAASARVTDVDGLPLGAGRAAVAGTGGRRGRGAGGVGAFPVVGGLLGLGAAVAGVAALRAGRRRKRKRKSA